jgi:hypothetical protein
VPSATFTAILGFVPLIDAAVTVRILNWDR